MVATGQTPRCISSTRSAPRCTRQTSGRTPSRLWVRRDCCAPAEFGHYLHWVSSPTLYLVQPSPRCFHRDAQAGIRAQLDGLQCPRLALTACCPPCTLQRRGAAAWSSTSGRPLSRLRTSSTAASATRSRCALCNCLHHNMLRGVLWCHAQMLHTVRTVTTAQWHRPNQLQSRCYLQDTDARCAGGQGGRGRARICSGEEPRGRRCGAEGRNPPTRHHRCPGVAPRAPPW
jgi:hypothetical protein